MIHLSVIRVCLSFLLSGLHLHVLGLSAVPVVTGVKIDIKPRVNLGRCQLQVLVDCAYRKPKLAWRRYTDNEHWTSQTLKLIYIPMNYIGATICKMINMFVFQMSLQFTASNSPHKNLFLLFLLQMNHIVIWVAFSLILLFCSCFFTMRASMMLTSVWFDKLLLNDWAKIL